MVALDALQQQQHRDAYALQDALVNQLQILKSDLLFRLGEMDVTRTAQLNVLQSSLHTDLLAPQTTQRVENRDLSDTVTDELMLLRTTLREVLTLILPSINTNGVDGRETLHTSLLQLSELLHTDLATLSKQQGTDMTSLQMGIHTDLTTLITEQEQQLSSLATAVHTDLDTMQRAQATQFTTERQDTARNMAILRGLLADWQQGNHDNLVLLTDSNRAAVQVVLAILNGSRQEQNLHSALLRIIANKNLSVQTFVNVFNQIDVVVNASNFK